MTDHERIIRNALDAARTHGYSAGAGGKAMSKVYQSEGGIDTETLLFMVAIMTNGLAALEPAGAL